MEERGAGWLLFSGTVLMIAGVMRFFDAIWAFSFHGSVPANLQDALFGHSLKTYGWVYLIVAIILFLAGLGVMVGSQFSRWIGIFAAAVAAISAVWWMPYYPIWSLTYVLVGVLVIYGLTAYGQRQTTAV